MREMRRKDRKLDSADTLEILKNGEYGVLATVTEDGSPYDVPIRIRERTGDSEEVQARARSEMR